MDADMARRLRAIERRLDIMGSKDAPTVRYAESDTSTPPTDAQVDTLFGTAANLHGGFIGIIYDTSTASTASYIVWVANDSWYRADGTLLT